MASAGLYSHWGNRPYSDKSFRSQHGKYHYVSNGHSICPTWPSKCGHLAFHKLDLRQHLLVPSFGIRASSTSRLSTEPWDIYREPYLNTQRISPTYFIFRKT